MKQLLLLGLSAGILLTACNQHRYVDLTSGAHIDLEKDENGNMVDSKTHKPVYMYVDTKTHDTIYGSTGAVINGHIVKTDDGKYKFFDAAYNYVSDRDNFPSLEAELKDQYYINRFKAMLR